MIRQVGAYGIIGGLCAGLNIAVLVCGDHAGLHYALSSTLSFLLCVCVGFAFHSRWTFKSEPSVEGLARYALALAVNLPASVVSLWLLHEFMKLPMEVAAPASTISLTAMNFILSRWAIMTGAPTSRCSPDRS